MPNPFDDLDDATPPAALKLGLPPSLLDRFRINFEAGQRYATIGGAVSDAMPSNAEDRRRFDLRYEAFPQFDGLLEGSAALAGQLAGAGASFENLLPIGLGAKVAGVAGLSLSQLRARVLAGAVDAAAVNAAIDPLIQGIEIGAGYRDNFDPVQAAGSVGLGAVAGGAFGGVFGLLARQTSEAPPARTGADPEAAAPEASPIGPDGQPEPVAATRPAALPAAPDDATPRAAETPPEPAPEPTPAERIEAVAAEVDALNRDIVESAAPEALGDRLAAEARTKMAAADVAPAGATRPRPRRPVKPVSLFRFLAAHGGLKGESPDGMYRGELRAMDLDKVFVPGGGRLVRQSGLDLDHARELAAEAGYLHTHGTPDQAMATTTVDDLLTALREEQAGNRVFAGEDLARVTELEAATRLRQEGDQLLQRRLDELEELAVDAGEALPPEIRGRAAEFVNDGIEPFDALERAVMEDYYANGSPEPIVRAGDEFEVPFDADVDASRVPGERPPVSPEGGEPAGGRRGPPDAGADGGPVRDAGGPRRAAVAAGDAVHAKLGGAANAPSRAAAGTPAAGRAALIRLRDIANAFADLLDVAAVRQGRLSVKGKAGMKAMGQFGTRTGVVRVRNQDDFDTFTHEVGHHVDQRLGQPLKALIGRHKAEVEALAYPGTKKGKESVEGFAEYFRLLLTNPAHAARQAPAFDAAFRAHLAANDPDMAKAIADTTAAYRDWLQQPSAQAVASTIASARRPSWLGRVNRDAKRNGIGSTIGDMVHTVYGFLFDDLHPIQRAVQALARIHTDNTGQRLALATGSDPYKLARLSRGAYNAGHMDIVHGVHAYRDLQPSSPALRDGIVEAMGVSNSLSKWDDARAQSFGAYLWSRRALGEWDRFDAGEIPNPPDKLTRGDHQVNVAELEAARPEFVTAAAKIHAWSRALWQKKRDAGLITEQAYQQGLAIRDYVPGLRMFDYDGDAAGAQSGQRGGSLKSGLVKRFRGSRRDVVNPLESLMADAYETAMAIARNDVVKQLDRLALLAGPGGGRIAERIPAHEMRATIVDPLEAVDNAAKQAGLLAPDRIVLRDAIESAIGDERAAIFRPAIINEKGEAIAFFRDAGELKALRLADGAFGKQMYRALTTMSRVERNFFIDMLAMPANLVRAGITTTLEFLGANFVRDQAMAAIFYGRPLHRVGRSLGGMADEVMGRDTSRAYNLAGGIMGGEQTAALRNANVERDMRALKRKGWRAQRLTSIKGMFEVSELTETGTRLGLFRTFFDEARKRGLDEFESGLEAAWRARDYIDFDRRGVGMGWARIVPFLNAAMQGLDKGARHMVAPLARKVLALPKAGGDDKAMGDAVKSWARLGVLTIAGMGLHAWMSRHPDYEEISETTRATHWMVKTGDKWLAIPKPFEMGAVLNLGEAAYDAMVKQDPTAAGRWLDGLGEVLLPPSVITGNPAVSSYFEIRTNTDFFTDAPIVPEHLVGMEPFLQYTARTSELSRQLGGAINMSPAVIDHLIVNHFGSWGRSALAMYDIAAGDKPAPSWDDMPILRRFIKDASKGATSSRAFWDLVATRTGEMEGAWQSYRALLDAGDPARAADYLAGLGDDARAFVAAKALPAEAGRLHPLVRARLAVQAISALRRDLVTNRMVNAAGDSVQLPSIARGAADDILSTLAMAEARNALVTLGLPGWRHREPIDTATFHRELAGVSPELFGVLADRYATAKVWPVERVTSAWPEYRRRLLADGSDALTLDLTAEAGAEGYELGGVRIRPAGKPPVPGAVGGQ